MEASIYQDLNLIGPEIILACGALFLQTAALFSEKISKASCFLYIFLFALVLYSLLNSAPKECGDISAFSGSFALGSSYSFIKIILVIFTLFSIILYDNLRSISKSPIQTEFYTLVSLSLFGGFIAISSKDFLLLFCGLELQSLIGYALVCLNNSSAKSSEAALKYFLYGAMVTCISLLGISFIYGFTGSIKFEILVKNSLSGNLNPAVLIGLLLLLSNILFKLSAAPFHFWTPDVYEGASLPAVSYISTVQKITAVAVLANLPIFSFGEYNYILSAAIKTVTILSLFIGSLGALTQNSLKRLVGYSAVLNAGFALIIFSFASPSARFLSIFYLSIYSLAVAGFFASLTALLGQKADEASFKDIAGVALERKTLAGSITLLIFSLIGLPPMAGFFAKYYIFYEAFKAEEYLIVFAAGLASVIAAFYYLKIIGSIFFEDPKKSVTRIPTKKGLSFIIFLSALPILFFPIFYKLIL